jgi:hypothetical protein
MSNENSNSEFWISLHNEAMRRLNTQRVGQSYFNALYILRPEIADYIRSSNADPYHDTEILPLFFIAIAEQL